MWPIKGEIHGSFVPQWYHKYINKEKSAFEYRVKASTSKWKNYFAKLSSQDLARLFENLLYEVGISYDLGADKKNSRFVTLMQEQHTRITFKHIKRQYLVHYKSYVFTGTIRWLHVHDCMITLHEILVPSVLRSLSPLLALRKQAVILGSTWGKELWEASSSWRQTSAPASSQQENAADARDWILPMRHELESGSINNQVSHKTPALADPLTAALSDTEAENPVTLRLDSHHTETVR